MARTGTCLTVALDEAACPFSEVTETLGQADLNIEGFSVQAHAEGAEAYLIVENVEQAQEALQAEGLNSRTYPFVAATLTSRPGMLAEAMSALNESGIDVQAAFPTISPWGPDVQIAFACDEPASAEKVLAELEP